MMVSSPDRGRTSGLLGRAFARTGMTPVLIVVLILFWEFGVRAFEIWSSAIPAPSRVLLEIWRNASQLRRHALVTGLETLTGLLLAAGTAFPLAVLSLRAARTRHFLACVTRFLTRIPLMALAPLMVIWFGFGTPPAAAICWLVCFSPMYTGFQAGLASVPAEVVEIIETMGAGPLRMFFRIRLPFCLPFAARAVKSSITISLAGAVVAEFVGSDTGLGYLMFNAGSKADSTGLFAALSILVLMGFAARGVISLVERKWIPWPAAEVTAKNMALQRTREEYARDGRN